jgi:hypothetical protein
LGDQLPIFGMLGSNVVREAGSVVDLHSAVRQECELHELKAAPEVISKQ